MSRRISATAAIIYLALFIASLVLARMAGGALAYILAILLTLPWSAAGVSIADSVSQDGLDNLWVGGMILGVGALLNALLVYYLAGKAQRVLASIGTFLS